MKKHKILIIGPTSPPYTGMSVATETLLDSSLRDKLDITHLDTSDRRAITNMGRFDLMNIFLAFKHSFLLLWLCSSRHFHMAYLPISQNSLGYLRDGVLLSICKLFGLKVIVHLHGGYFRKFYDASGSFMKRIVRSTLSKVSAVVVLGESLRYIFKGLVPENKIFVVSNGVQDYFDKDIHDSSKDGTFRVLFLSNFLREKGLFEVLKIVPLAVRRCNNIKFVFAGEWNNRGDDKEAQEFIKENNIQAHTEFVGVVDSAEKIKLLNKVDLLVLPTFYPLEGQPLVILEAMSAFLPVITTRKGAIAETIRDGENGFLVEAKDSQQLVDRIMRLISEPSLYSTIAAKNRDDYLKKYTKNIFAGDLYAIFAGVGRNIPVKPKVLVVGYLPPPQEGTAKMTETIVYSKQLRDNFQIRFLSLFKRRYVSSRGKFGMANIVHNLINILNYIRFIIVFNPNVIYMPLAQNKFGFFRDSVFILAAKIFGKRAYIHFHGGSFDLFYAMQRRAYKKYIAFVLGRIDCLILLANKFKDQFTLFVKPERIFTLYNCIPKVPVIDEPKKVFPSDKKTAKVLFVGYLSKAKGALDLVRAIPKVVAKYNGPVEFVLCGQPVDIERNIVFIPEPHLGYSKIIEMIKEKNLYPYTKIKKEVVAEEKTLTFSEADIFVFPSYSEGCGLVVLEAMGFGLPVVTTSAGALEEMLAEDDNCLFVKPGDTEALSEKILFLLNNPSICRQMGRANKKLVEEKYNLDVFSNNMTQIWSTVSKVG